MLVQSGFVPNAWASNLPTIVSESTQKKRAAQ